MDDKVIDTLLYIASVGLSVSGIIFICIAIFSETEGSWVLPAALICILLGTYLIGYENPLRKADRSLRGGLRCLLAGDAGNYDGFTGDPAVILKLIFLSFLHIIKAGKFLLSIL